MMDEITSPNLADLCKPPIKPLSETPAVNPALKIIPVLEELLEGGESKCIPPTACFLSDETQTTPKNVHCDSVATLRTLPTSIVDTEAERAPPPSAPVQTALDLEQGPNLPPISELPPPAEQGTEARDLGPPSPSSIDLELGPLPVKNTVAECPNLM